MKFGDLSYRFKMPLVISVVIVVTVSLTTAVLAWNAFYESRKTIFRTAVEVGSILSNSLPDVLLREDLWGAFQLIRAAEGGLDVNANRLLVVLDGNSNIVVSNRPKQYTAYSSLADYGKVGVLLDAEIASSGNSIAPWLFDPPENKHLYILIPVLSDGVRIGTLVNGYDRSIYWARFKSVFIHLTYSAIASILILIPLGGWLGHRMVQPLTRLNNCMNRVSDTKATDIACDLVEGNDEVGRLGKSFLRMLDEIAEKERLEASMLSSERLAAVGRLTAGVAHEINNPLGGMLNAVNTFKKYSQTDETGAQTMFLIERGLEQIRDTVSPLLVEARGQSHDLTNDDINDVHALLIPTSNEKQVKLDWNCTFVSIFALPATPIRQVLMNLVLNAIQASEPGTVVGCRIICPGDKLLIEVSNVGDEIPRERLIGLFEPFPDGARGSGLGLWVTYQLVQQMSGSIGVTSEDGETRFRVEIPVDVI